MRQKEGCSCIHGRGDAADKGVNLRREDEKKKKDGKKKPRI